MPIVNRTRILAALCVPYLLASTPGSAALRAIEEAYEATLSSVELPGNDNGYVMVRLCERCRPEVLRVNAQTRYILRPGRGDLTLRDFRAAAGTIADRGRVPVYVYYDARTRQVRRLVLDLGR